MRRVFYVVNLTILIILGVYAKDGLIIEFKNLLNDPKIINQTGTIEVAFSPNKGASQAIIKAIGEARSSILVSAYSFTSKNIAQALLEAKKRNIKIKIILDKSQVSHKYSSSKFFAHQDFDLRIDTKHAIYHNKIMIIDNKNIITGSFNFTQSAETRNAENILIIRDNISLANLYTENWWSHWNNAVSLEEFMRKKNKEV